MPFYQSKGIIPKKRHTVFKNSDGGIYYEELVSRKGFSHIYSNLYHLEMPTNVCKVGRFKETNLKKMIKNFQHTPKHFKTKDIEFGDNHISGRKLILYNNDLYIYKVHISSTMKNYYRNGHFDELYYVQDGKGTLKTNLGLLEFSKGDYIVIPRGIIYKINLSASAKMLLIESVEPIEIPKKYRNRSGQLMEHSPFCERDIKTPILEKNKDKKGIFKVDVRLNNGIQTYYYENNPFDVVGWDGYYFPWIFNINDFEPITGSIHQPPPVHQTFEARKFVVCSFVSRQYDYHPDAIPAPYPHSNVDSDEVIFYSKGNFMSRKGIESESITLHPMGLPHGPQPGKYEESIGKKNTDELAVMIDTFSPLIPVEGIDDIIDKNYPLSWNSK